MNDIHTITGIVVIGNQIGEKIGYPTANLDIKKIGDVKRGVYAGLVERVSNGETYKAGIVIGAQDTHNPPKVEAYLINFKDNLYDEKLVFHLKKYIREIKNYDDDVELKQDIAKDIDTIKKMTF